MVWAQCAAIAGDETGRLYGVARSDVHPGTYAVWVADVYPDALTTTNAQEAAVLLNDVPVVQVVQTVPAIDFDVTAAAASADGHQLLLVGATRKEDAAPVLALVDLYSSQPAAAAAAAGGSTPSGRYGIGSSSSSHPAAKQRIASLYFVHQALYSERPSMQILKAAWHPSSPGHFAALASDNRWRLYHTSRLSEAEQTFALRLPGGQQSVGLRTRGAFGASGSSSSSSSGLPPRLTSFAFGPPSSGWASLAVLLLASNGGVYVLCPVAPFGMRVAGGVLQRLLDGSSDSTAHAWLLAAFLSVLTHESEATSARPHMLETAAPALQGPLNKGCESLKQRTVRSVACTLALSSSTSGGGGLALNPSAGSLGSGFSVVATGFSNGSVYAHVLELGQVLPAWLDAAPQCAFDKKGDVAAVRYEVEAVPAAPAAAGLAPVGEEPQQQYGAAAAAAAAAASGGLVSPLLLLDVLKINLHSPAAAGTSDWVAEGEADSAGGSLTDSDEESDAGYDPSAARGGCGGSSSSRQRSGRVGSSRGGGGLGAGGLGFGSDDDDAAEDLEDQQLLQLRKVTLHAAPELAGRFWACHDQGCWGINIRWLQQLAARLDDAAAAAAAAAAGADGAGLGQLQLQLQLQQQQQQQLAAPVLQELLVSGSAVASSCVVGNALLGSGCVVLEAPGQYEQQTDQGLGGAAAAAGGGGGGCLTFLRPRPAGVLGEGVLGGLGEGEDEGLGLGDLALSPEEVDAKSRMDDFYADICRGPRRLPPPQRPPSLPQLTAADPAGLKYLNDAAGWLLRTHVEFANGAHADLTERARQLHDEAHEQTAAIATLRQLAAAASQRQEAIAARLARLGGVADSLAERSGLLAGLHWSLPRPASAAEQQMEKQLEVWEQRLQQLKASWRALQAQLAAYTPAAAAAAADAAAATPSRATGSGLNFGTPLSSIYGGGAAAGGYASPLLQQTPASAAARSPFLGVPALASNRARDRRQVTKPPQGLVNPAKLQQLKEMLAAQNVVITTARERLSGLFEEVDAYRLEHPEVELPGRLRSSRVVV